MTLKKNKKQKCNSELEKEDAACKSIFNRGEEGLTRRMQISNNLQFNIN